MLQQKEYARTGCKRSKPPPRRIGRRAQKSASEALRWHSVPPPAQSAGAVGDSGPQYPGGLKGPLRQLQEFSGPLHLLLNEGVSDLLDFRKCSMALATSSIGMRCSEQPLRNSLARFFLGGMTGEDMIRTTKATGNVRFPCLDFL